MSVKQIGSDGGVGCDIFCNVIDNYGDIGVSWRLARQLANEFGLRVRLWVDDLASFAKLCPEADVSLTVQWCSKVKVCLWHGDLAGITPAQLVIDAFGCKLPQAYLAAMEVQQPVWINLEYLSAESWVEGCHKLPSPKPPLTRYFFFPGFTLQTGGLLLERDLLARRDAFLTDRRQQQTFWQAAGLEMPAEEVLKVSLFSYENQMVKKLFDDFSRAAQPVLCLVPEGRILSQVRQYFAAADGRRFTRGNLEVRVLPFVRQEEYDALLWASDVNFVRGEDSCVRAQWAGKPFVWQIYPQQDEVHWQKLQAFLELYCRELDSESACVLQNLWRVWNGGGGELGWQEFSALRAGFQRHAGLWAEQLATNNLALNLLDFSQEIGRMRAFKIEGQST